MVRRIAELSLPAKFAVGGGILAMAAALLADGSVTFRPETGRAALVSTGLSVFVAATTVDVLLKRRTLQLNFATNTLIVLLLWCAVITSCGKPGYLGWFQWAKFVALTSGVLALSAWPVEQVTRLASRVLIVSLIALFGFWGLGAVAGWESAAWRFSSPLSLHFGNPNMLGATLALAVVYTAGMVWGEVQRVWRILGIAAVVMGSAMIVATDSRGAILFSLAGGTALVLALCRWVEQKSWLASVLWASAFFIIVSFGLGQVSTEHFQTKIASMSSGVSESDHGRWQLYQHAWNDLSSSMVMLVAGNGLGRFSRVSYTWNPRDYHVVTTDTIVSDYVHSEYLEWWLDAGIVGLVLWLVLWGATLYRLLRQASDIAFPVPVRALAVTLMATMVVWLGIGLADVSTRYSGPQLLAWLILGIAWHMPLTSKSNDTIFKRVTLPRWLVVMTTAVSIMSAAIILSYTVSELWTLRAYQHIQKKDVKASLMAGKQAVRWNPRNPDARYLLLKLAGETGNLELGRMSKLELDRSAPAFRDADRWWGELLFAVHDYPGSTQALRRYQKKSPYDFMGYQDLPTIAFLSGDRAILDQAVTDLFVSAIEFLNSIEKTNHQVNSIYYSGSLALEVIPADGSPSLTLPVSGLVGIIWSSAPTSIGHGRQMTRDGLNHFLKKELGARTQVIPENLLTEAVVSP